MNVIDIKCNQCLLLYCPAESDDQNSVASPEKLEPQYTEVQTKQADPNRGELASDF